MTFEQQETIAQQLERAAEIMRGDASPAEKINTLDRIGAICTFQGRKWADETYNNFLETL